MCLRLTPRLDALLEGSAKTQTLTLLDAVAVILSDNKLPFFPAFTDHGLAHLEGVLDVAENLVPEDVWASNSLRPADAAALISAALLHDLAMHLREDGFVALMRDVGRQPLPWLAERREPTWAAGWLSFQREARNMGRTQLERILGPQIGVPSVAYTDPAALDPIGWTEADRLLIGEFLRRHHARLAHELAVFGFPGASDFPRLVEVAPAYADIAGFIARSHGEPLRDMILLLERRYPGNLRPGGVLAPYLMALLRIADYLQLQSSRAPGLLLQLRNPRSQVTHGEWTRHNAVANISWDNRDPYAIYVEVRPDHSLGVHLALEGLIQDVQRELDTTTSVLSETYAGTTLSHLRLSRARVKTNLNDEMLCAGLPYVPRAAALRSSEDLFRLVIHDLYGTNRAVGGRELVQNAVDAVRAIGSHRPESGVPPIQVEIACIGEGSYALTVSDAGVGMTPDIVIDFFLEAGASFGPILTDDEANDAGGALKSGRFGIGAFAAFLLGHEMHVSTRHIDAERGVAFAAHPTSDLIELRWKERDRGTQVVVPFGSDDVEAEHLLHEIAGFYAAARPEVEFWFTDAEGRRRPVESTAVMRVPMADEERLPPDWRAVAGTPFEALLWCTAPLPKHRTSATIKEQLAGAVAHNGLWLHEKLPTLPAYRWQSRVAEELVTRPTLSVVDPHHRLPVTLHRYGVRDRRLWFEDDLLRAIGADVVAHAIVRGPRQHPLGVRGGLTPVNGADGTWFPFLPTLVREYAPDALLVFWDSEVSGGERLHSVAGAWTSLPRPWGPSAVRLTEWLRWLLGAKSVTSVSAEMPGERDTYMLLRDSTQSSRARRKELARRLQKDEPEVSICRLGAPASLPHAVRHATLEAAKATGRTTQVSLVRGIGFQALAAEPMAEPWMKVFGEPASHTGNLRAIAERDASVSRSVTSWEGEFEAPT